MVNFSVSSSSSCEDVAGETARNCQGITPSRRICRNLFREADNYDALQEELREQNIETLQEKKLKYNFDFEKEEALPGRYLWEKVSTSNRTNNSCNTLTTEYSEILKNTSSQIRFGKSDSASKTKSNSTKEHKITDYFRAKKRKHNGTMKEVGFKKTKLLVTEKESENNCPCLSTCSC